MWLVYCPLIGPTVFTGIRWEQLELRMISCKSLFLCQLSIKHWLFFYLREFWHPFLTKQQLISPIVRWIKDKQRILFFFLSTFPFRIWKLIFLQRKSLTINSLGVTHRHSHLFMLICFYGKVKCYIKSVTKRKRRTNTIRYVDLIFLRVTDGDEGQNSEIQLSCVQEKSSPDACDTFDVFARATGWVLDRFTEYIPVKICRVLLSKSLSNDPLEVCKKVL